MSSVEKKTFATEKAEVMEPNNAKVEIVNVGGIELWKLQRNQGGYGPKTQKQLRMNFIVFGATLDNWLENLRGFPTFLANSS